MTGDTTGAHLTLQYTSGSSQGTQLQVSVIQYIPPTYILCFISVGFSHSGHDHSKVLSPFPVKVMAANLPRAYLEPMVQFLACALEDTLHVEFYLCWCSEVLTSHGSFIKDRAGSLSVALTALQKAMTVKRLELGKM